MKIRCPQCSTILAVPDELAGRQVRCPKCQQVTLVPAPQAVVVAALAERPAPTADYCPECGRDLPAGIGKCRACGWVKDGRGGPAAATPDDEDAIDDKTGRVYLRIRDDEVDLTPAIRKRLKTLIETEALNLILRKAKQPAPDELGPADLLIAGDIDVCDYGSQFIRYFLTFMAWIGPGSCKLEVSAEVTTAEGGTRDVTAKARQAVGVFGGNGDTLMKQNVKIVATRIANEAARHVSGRRFLNAHVYNLAYWALGLGIASLIPFIGVALALTSVGLGAAALHFVSQRDLPRGRVPAIIGLGMSALGLVFNAFVIWLARQA